MLIALSDFINSLKKTEMKRKKKKMSQDKAKEVINVQNQNAMNNESTTQVESTDNAPAEIVNESTANTEAVNKTKAVLQNVKQALEQQKSEDTKSIETISKKLLRTEKKCITALQAIPLPKTPVEFRTIEKSTEETEIISKKRAEVIIGLSSFNMAATKSSLSMGEMLINDPNFEQRTIYVTRADIYYNEGVELKDLNGHVIPPGTPNVYVPVNDSGSYWKWYAYHNQCLKAEAYDEQKPFIPDVRIKEFDSLQELGMYTGMNMMNARGMNGKEKVRIALLATGKNEYLEKIHAQAVKLETNISVMMRVYNNGNTLSAKIVNNAMLGVIENDFSENLSNGDSIVEATQRAGFDNSIWKDRYYISGITALANYTPVVNNVLTDKIGFKKVITVINSLSSEIVAKIEGLESDKESGIFCYLLSEYDKLFPVSKADDTAA